MNESPGFTRRCLLAPALAFLSRAVLRRPDAPGWHESSVVDWGPRSYRIRFYPGGADGEYPPGSIVSPTLDDSGSPTAAEIVMYPAETRPPDPAAADPAVGLLDVKVIRMSLCSAVVRSWTVAGARACRLCRRGCSAILEPDGTAGCVVYAPPGMSPSGAAVFACEQPREHYVEKPAPPTVYIKRMASGESAPLNAVN